MVMDGPDPPASRGEVLPTLDQEAGDDKTPILPAKPVLDLAGFGHYVDLQPIGSGGAGQVFRAFDPQLKRYVALKFLWIDSAEHAARFKHEAQAQARLEHDHVCKVYEVGDIAGRLFLAMQYVNGRTMREAARVMTVADRVQAMKQVAEAIQAAHKHGIIHRDLKPTNIMVERTDDGTWKPYVMDFGLARELESQTITKDVAVGTPQYMSPEQARGATVDVRTDVYGLGATLYSVLVDRPPFTGVTAPEVMLQVMRDEPTRLRRIASSIPRDLETLTMKCLEKDPSRRYQTARELAEDLGRFLDGEPILAQPPTLRYLLLKRARKHRAAVAAGTLAFVAISAAGGVAIHARNTAAERARLAQVFGQEAQEIEAVVRYAHLLPLHDTRRETAAVRARMSSIEDQLERLGPVAEGPGAYVLGRARLALGEPDAARRELERAWKAGWRTDDVACTLGQALGELYERALADAERIDNPEVQKRERARAERELRDPALQYLKQGVGSHTMPASLVEGLIAFHERRFEPALAAAIKAAEEMPWLYEAHRLQGDVHSARGSGFSNHGEYDAATRELDAAAAAYHEAQSIARSDGASYLAECRLGSRRMSTLIVRGASPEPAFHDMRQVCDAALTTSGDPNAEAELAYAWAQLSEYQQQHTQDPLPAIDQAVAVVRRVLARDPTNELALASLGFAMDCRAESEDSRGQDPRASLQAGVDAYRRAIATHPSANNLNLLAALGVRRAEYELDHGLDPEATLRDITRVLDEGVARDPDVFALHANYGLLYKIRAQYELAHGRDPHASTEIEMSHLRRSLSINPNFARLHRELGTAFALRAQHALERGEDPSADVERAIAEQRTANQVSASVPFAFRNMVEALLLRAAWQVRQHQDATATFAEAERQLDEARKMAPVDTDNEFLDAQLQLLAARAAKREALPALLERAAKGAAPAVKQNPNSTEALITLAEVRGAQAEIETGPGADARLQDGLALVARALAVNPSLARAYVLRGRLLSALATRKPGDEALRRDAEAAFARAKTLNPLLSRDLVP
jgi:serine/threonine-protein kinase